MSPRSAKTSALASESYVSASASKRTSAKSLLNGKSRLSFWSAGAASFVRASLIWVLASLTMSPLTWSLNSSRSTLRMLPEMPLQSCHSPSRVMSDVEDESVKRPLSVPRVPPAVADA